MVDGKLQPCPSAPHCVGSDDPHRAHLPALPRTRFVEERADYCHVAATSRWLRFTDDVEFLLRPERGEIAMRSSSRLGYYDFAANRERLEAIRSALRARKLVE